MSESDPPLPLARGPHESDLTQEPELALDSGQVCQFYGMIRAMTPIFQIKGHVPREKS